MSTYILVIPFLSPLGAIHSLRRNTNMTIHFVLPIGGLLEWLLVLGKLFFMRMLLLVLGHIVAFPR
jgi:hypothetical protein